MHKQCAILSGVRTIRNTLQCTQYVQYSSGTHYVQHYLGTHYVQYSLGTHYVQYSPGTPYGHYSPVYTLSVMHPNVQIVVSYDLQMVTHVHIIHIMSFLCHASLPTGQDYEVYQ